MGIMVSMSVPLVVRSNPIRPILFFRTSDSPPDGREFESRRRHGSVFVSRIP
jgi:hypothetical protein